MKTFFVYIDDWDNEVDGEEVDVSGLETEWMIRAEDEEQALNLISDETGFCILAARIIEAP